MDPMRVRRWTKKEIRELVDHAKAEHGITQDQLAREWIGCSKQILTRWLSTDNNVVPSRVARRALAWAEFCLMTRSKPIDDANQGGHAL